MFEDRIVTIHLSDILFLLAFPFVIGSIVQLFYYDESFGLQLLIPAVISLLAYFWKFWVTSVKKEEKSINSPEINLKGNLKTKLSSKKFFEA